ncbi:MAG: cytochrome c3 family protein [Candidatus Zixiibacteriota bacterium]
MFKMPPLFNLQNHTLIPILCCLLGVFSTAVAGPPSPCLDCHEDLANSLASTSHSPANKVVEVSCVSCHVDYTVHLDEPESDNVTNPAGVEPLEALDICSGCHFGESESDFAHAGKHFKEGVNCSGCHKIHNPYGPSSLAEKDVNRTCFACHIRLEHSFAGLSSHPVKSGAMTCIDCHDYFKDLGEPFTTFDKNSACYKCHTEMDGPFLYEHEASRDFGLEDGGCLNCHDPHGSAFVNLLKEPASQLCRQCHQVPTHFTAHNGAYAVRDCLECHIDVHGSDTDKHYFSTSFSSQLYGGTCNQRGCHPIY